MQAVILAGGFGTRLAHVVPDVPKPMAPIKEKPFLAYQIELLRNNGFDNFILLTGYLSKVIEKYFTDTPDVKCIKETTALGTGGAVLNAYPQLEDEFCVINGDTFFDIDFSVLYEFAKDKNAVLALRYSQDIARYGLVNTNSNFKIESFTEKGNLPANFIDGYINGGIYYFKKQTLAPLYQKFERNNVSMENDIFPLLINAGNLYGLPCGGGFIDIGIPDDYYRAQTYIPNILSQRKIPAVFVDKDGTLIENTGYPHGTEITVIASTLKLLKKYYNDGYLLIMITNQAGIAKGKFSFDEMQQNIDSIKKHYARNGISFADVQYCPYHSEGTIPEYRFVSKARKPEAGMILRACENCRIDLKKSVMIGDNPSVDNINLPYLKTVIIGEHNV